MVLKGAYEEAVCPLALNPSLSIACTESRSGFPTSPFTAFQRALDSLKPAVVLPTRGPEAEMRLCRT